MHFKDKIVYCNCDDPRWSNFVKYFQINFDTLGLKKLIATGYRKNCRGLKLIYDSDRKDANIELLEGNGDFRSPECVELLKQADIVVTNPPFSLFREYVAQLVEHGKKFLVLGNMNALKYKEIFPLIKANKIWVGHNFNKTMEFRLDESYERWNEIREGFKYGKVPAIAWYTNLDVKKRHEFLTLTEKYDPVKYPKYDNYDAINVDKVNDIPKDYDGVMGVPISFLDKYIPEQFEIVGTTENGLCDKALWINPEEKHNEPFIDGKKKYTRILIRRKPLGENAETPAA